MSLPARLHFSLLIVRHALVPVGSLAGRQLPSHGRGEDPCLVPRQVTATELAWLFANLQSALDDAGNLSLFFPGALPLTAPFLLFRLKRLGFSACRVTADGEGLLLTASR
ncbi:MAG: hypothetical protein CXR31_03205 [Geobacter sp.]|nr:MAG: hypothetical protein CXR31_03205 [Geobacter sp.]